MLDQVKRVFKDTAIYSLGSLLPKMAGIILAPIYTAYLSTAQYGVYSLAAMITSMVTVVMLLGQDGSLTLYYRQQAKSDEDHREMLFTVVVFILGFSSLVLLVLMLLGPIYTPWLTKEKAFTFRPYVVVALLTAWMMVPLSMQQAVNRAQGHAKLHTVFQLSQFAINTGFTLLFVVVFRQGAYGSLKGTFLGAALVVPFALYVLVTRWRPRFTRSGLKQSLSFGLPLVPHYFLGGFALTFADRLMLGRLTSLAQVGVYSYAYNLSMALNLVTTSINRAWGPIYYDLAGKEEGRRQLPRLTTVYASAVGIAAIGFTLYMPDVLVLLASRKAYWAGAGIMPVIVAGYFFFAMYMVVSTPIFYAAKTRWLPVLSATALALNVGINLFAIPAYGMYGAAWATFAAYLLMAGGARYLAGRVGGRFEDGRMAAIVGIYALGFAAQYGIAALDLNIFAGMALKAVAFAALVGSFVLFRVVTVDEIRSALRRRRKARAEVTTEQVAELEAREAEEISATSDATGFNSDGLRP